MSKIARDAGAGCRSAGLQESGPAGPSPRQTPGLTGFVGLTLA
ncbi:MULTISPECIES: hypothetical protein [unclassified Raoultella]|nr:MULTISPECIES: hypothetical protein [unclassified Raoultella]